MRLSWNEVRARAAMFASEWSGAVQDQRFLDVHAAGCNLKLVQFESAFGALLTKRTYKSSNQADL